MNTNNRPLSIKELEEKRKEKDKLFNKPHMRRANELVQKSQARSAALREKVEHLQSTLTTKGKESDALLAGDPFTAKNKHMLRGLENAITHTLNYTPPERTTVLCTTNEVDVVQLLEQLTAPLTSRDEALP